MRATFRARCAWGLDGCELLAGSAHPDPSVRFGPVQRQRLEAVRLPELYCPKIGAVNANIRLFRREGRRALIQNAQIGGIGEDPAPLTPSDLVDDLEPLEFGQRRIDSGRR